MNGAVPLHPYTATRHGWGRLQFFLLCFNRRSKQFCWEHYKGISMPLIYKAGGMNERYQCPHHRLAQCDTAYSAASRPLVESQRENTCRIMTVYYDHTVIKQTVCVDDSKNQ